MSVGHGGGPEEEDVEPAVCDAVVAQGARDPAREVIGAPRFVPGWCSSFEIGDDLVRDARVDVGSVCHDVLRFLVPLRDAGGLGTCGQPGGHGQHGGANATGAGRPLRGWRHVPNPRPLARTGEKPGGHQLSQLVDAPRSQEIRARVIC